MKKQESKKNFYANLLEAVSPELIEAYEENFSPGHLKKAVQMMDQADERERSLSKKATNMVLITVVAFVASIIVMIIAASGLFLKCEMHAITLMIKIVFVSLVIVGFIDIAFISYWAKKRDEARMSKRDGDTYLKKFQIACENVFYISYWADYTGPTLTPTRAKNNLTSAAMNILGEKSNIEFWKKSIYGSQAQVEKAEYTETCSRVRLTIAFDSLFLFKRRLNFFKEDVYNWAEDLAQARKFAKGD